MAMCCLPSEIFQHGKYERNAINEIEYFVIYEMEKVLYLLWEMDLYLDVVLEEVLHSLY